VCTQRFKFDKFNPSFSPDPINANLQGRAVVYVEHFAGVGVDDLGDEAAVPDVVDVEAGAVGRHEQAVKRDPELGQVGGVVVEDAEINCVRYNYSL
jgi:hypothetical protein